MFGPSTALGLADADFEHIQATSAGPFKLYMPNGCTRLVQWLAAEESRAIASESTKGTAQTPRFSSAPATQDHPTSLIQSDESDESNWPRRFAWFCSSKWRTAGTLIIYIRSDWYL